MTSAFYDALAFVRKELTDKRVNHRDFDTAIEWAITMTTRPRYYLPLYVDYVYPIAMYLEWVNNYLTVRRFAEDHGMEAERARALLELGKALHEIESNFYSDMRGTK